MPDTHLNAPTDGSRSDSVRIASSLLLFSSLLYGLAVRGGTGSTSSIIVIVATAAMAGSLYARQSDKSVWREMDSDRRVSLRLLVGIVLFGLLGAAGWANSAIGPTSTALERLPGLVWLLLGVGVYLLRDRQSKSTSVVLLLATLGFTLLVGLTHIAAAQDVGLDVLFLHKEAATALANGVNPYTDVVEVADKAPTAEPGDVISGYVYPPITAVAYSIGEWAVSDPRYTSLVAWLAILAMIGVHSVRRRRHVGLLVMILLASLPGWPLVLRAAWTEPVTLAFLTAGFFLWRRTMPSGAGLGLALASKQYFVVTGPLLLLNRDRGWKKRLIVASVAILATLAVGIFWDPGAFWSSAVEFHTTTPPRPDSINLVGLLAGFGIVWHPPTFLAVAIGLTTAAILGRTGHDPEWFFVSLGLSLALSFLVTTQAFANYWFLIAGICAVALLAPITDKLPPGNSGIGHR